MSLNLGRSVQEPAADAAQQTATYPEVEVDDEHIAIMAGLFQRRTRLLARPLSTTPQNLAALEAALWRHLDAMLWAPRDVLAFAEPLASESDPAIAFAMALVVLSAGDAALARKTLMLAAEGSSEVRAAVMAAAGLCPRRAIGDALDVLARDPNSLPGVRVDSLRALIGRQEADPTLLEASASCGDDLIAAVACDGLMRQGGVEAMSAIEKVAETASDWSARAAALKAAAVLGSTWALDEAREWAQQGPADELIDVLAVAGDASDSVLLGMAAETEALSGHAMVGLAWLGDARAADVIPRVAGAWGLAEEAAVATTLLPTGSGDGGRVLCARPWTVLGVLDVLGDETLPLTVRELASLELAARLAVPAPLPVPSSPAHHQRAAVTDLRSMVLPVADQFFAGAWLRRGARVT